MFNEEKINAWKLEKHGKFSASEINKLNSKGKDGNIFGAGALTYIKRVARESVTLYNDKNGVQTYDMRMGNINEPQAFAFLKAIIRLDTLEHYGGNNPIFKRYCNDSGCSPDSVAYTPSGAVSFGAELKCPNEDTHWDYLRDIKDQYDLKLADADHYGQIQFTMMCFGVDLWLWSSYNEFFPFRDRMLLIEVKKDDSYCNPLEIRVKQAVKEKYKLVEEYMNRHK